MTSQYGARTGPRRLGAVAALAALLLAGCSPADEVPSPSPTDDVLPGVSSGDGNGPTSEPTVPVIVGGPPSASVAQRSDVVTGLDAPWDLQFMPDGSILVSQRDSGDILRVSDGAATALGGEGIDQIKSALDATGEAGLLGIAVHPDDPGLLYAYLTRGDGNAVIRMPLDGNQVGGASDVVAGIPKARNHDGGRIAFGPDGYLYITTGDAAQPSLAQDRDSLAGKILRVVADGTDADGDPAPGNPFGSRVWSYGHRNVEGLGWVADGRMYASEFGQNQLDELNLIKPGANYGWPQVEGLNGAPSGTDLGETVNGITYPVAQWSTAEASPSGIGITTEGIYMAALRGQAVWRIPLSGQGTRAPHVLIDDLGRIRHVEPGPDGALYVVTNNTDGRGSPRSGDDRIVRVVVETG